MLFEEALHIIPQLKNKSLPGEHAHEKIMDSEVRKNIFINYGHTSPYRESAVIALLYPDEHRQARMLFILRKSYDGHHSGQIAFPGGKKEPEDAGLLETAVRETYEETGVKPDEIQIIKSLSEVFIPVSNYLVQPFLAISNHKPDFVKDPVEVEAILELPFGEILKNPLVPLDKTYHDKAYRIYAFQVEKYQIWGATAMILAEIRDLFGF